MLASRAVQVAKRGAAAPIAAATRGAGTAPSSAFCRPPLGRAALPVAGRARHAAKSSLAVAVPPPEMADAYATRGATWGLAPRATPAIDDVEAAAKRGPLPATTVADFERAGFAVLRGVFSAEEIAPVYEAAQEVARKEAEAAAAADGGVVSASSRCVLEPPSLAFARETEAAVGSNVRSVFALHKGSRPDDADAAEAARNAPATPEDLLAALLHDSRLVARASQLLGDNVYIHQSRINYQPAFVGTGFGWHSDFETWHAEDGMPLPRALSAVVMLSDNTASNGALMVVPGSHTSFVRCAGETPDANWEASLRSQRTGVPSVETLAELCARAEAEHGKAVTHCEGRVGDVIMFDCNLMHGSTGNLSHAARTNAFVVYNAVGNAVTAPPYAPVPRPEHVATRDPQWMRPLPTTLRLPAP